MPRISSLGTIGGMGMGLGRKLPIQAIQAILSSNADDVVISSLFTAAEWSSSVKKEVVINSGVTIGQQSGTAALVADTGFGGELEIINNGSVIGRSGVPGDINLTGGDGGNAFEAQQSGITLINNGNIYAGGGGGGSGGQGGQGQNGSYQVSYYVYRQECYNCFNPYPDFYCRSYGYPYVTCQTLQQRTEYAYGSAGGSGGAGGYGAGVASGSVYTSGQTGASGQAGSNPDSGAGRGGTGGTGGTGGDYGQAGSTGSQGAIGGATIYSPTTSQGTGSVGFAGGAAGTAIVNSGNVTLTNNGTIL